MGRLIGGYPSEDWQGTLDRGVSGLTGVWSDNDSRKRDRLEKDNQKEQIEGETKPMTMQDLPQGCGPERTIRQESIPHSVEVGRVDITYYCTNCGMSSTVAVRWRSHHALPAGWRCRDILPTHELPRRTNHLFCCPDKGCRKALDTQYPPPAVPKWFTTS